MGDSEGFREEIKAIIRKHDPGPKELRQLADDIDQLAERFETLDNEL